MKLTRREMLKRTGGAAAAVAAAQAQTLAQPVSRRNILWLTCEDMGPHLGCYGAPHAHTPHLDAFASEGARYTAAFSVSGVCAPSRSCLITGMYPTTLGTQHMRCSNPPPEHVKCFPEYLRNAGYYCTNNRKTDYNFPVPPGAWDENSAEAHWRSRQDPDQPFFAVFNFTGTHESSTGTLPEPDAALHGPPRDPAALELPPYYPDTPVARAYWAHYFDLVTRMDAWVGGMLAELEADGLADNTVVFFYSDHGVGFPRAKRWLYDSGLHVPLIVRGQGLAEPGSVVDNLVSFVDFAPTALRIAGLTPPAHMHGHPFLPDNPRPRSFLFAARDRMDERYDLIRAARDRRYKYIRNFLPHRPYGQYLTYPENLGMMAELRRAHANGELGPVQLQFFRATKPIEELYDTGTDPHETVNLAQDAQHARALDRLRNALNTWMAETDDLGLVPEMELEDWLDSWGVYPEQPPAAPYTLPQDAAGLDVFGRAAQEWLDLLNGGEPLPRLHAANALGFAGPEMAPLLMAMLRDPMGAVCYWAAQGLAHQNVEGAEARAALRAALERPEASARLGAAEGLIRLGHTGDGLPTALEGFESPRPYVRLYAAQLVDGLDVIPEAAVPLLEQAAEDANNYVVRVAEHALARLRPASP